MRLGLPHLGAAMLATIAIAWPQPASAQAYPSKPIRLIAAAPPGGALDAIARVVAQKLSTSVGQPVVTDNRAGAGGNIAAELAAKSAPDGYTMVMVSVSHVINPSLYSKLSYDAVRDFVPVTQVDSAAFVFVVEPSSTAKSIGDLLARGRTASPGLTYASSGIGQASHLGMELLRSVSGVTATHVPYKGDGPAILDVIGQRVDTFMASIPGALPHVRSGKLRALAVTSLNRSAFMPEVPTVAESGFPGFNVVGFRGILLPAETPPAIVAKLHSDLTKVLADPEVRERIRALGADVVGNTPKEFAAFLQSELVKWEKVVKASGAKAE